MTSCICYKFQNKTSHKKMLIKTAQHLCEISNVQFIVKLLGMWNWNSCQVLLLWLLKIFFSLSCSLTVNYCAEAATGQHQQLDYNRKISSSKERQKRNNEEEEREKKERAYSHGRHEAIIFITNYHSSLSLSHSLTSLHAKLKIPSINVYEKYILDRWAGYVVFFRACLCI